MELEPELARVFLEEARAQLGVLGDGARPRSARLSAAEGLSTAAGLCGLADVKGAAEAAAATLRAGAEPDAHELARLLMGVTPAAGIEPGELDQLLVAFRQEAAE